MGTNFILKLMEENNLELEEKFRLEFITNEAGEPIYFNFSESDELEGIIQLKSHDIFYTKLYGILDITNRLLNGKCKILKD